MAPASWWLLVFHPDFTRNNPLGQKIKEYGFFYYAIDEAQILSDKEEASVENIFKNIQNDYHLPIDNFSQDVIVSQLELLLTCCDRYYNRGFITKKAPVSDLLTKMESLLTDHFNDDKIINEGLPGVSQFAEQLNMPPNI